ncbi:MAG TPA: response regulator [Sulfuricurvum kujiense]|uniref:Response regulator n=2 Tax=Sulfuricurvum TaxID=286130 RepID=A0A2D3WHA3_9BACT|nr:response regulator [Sulfuricurvum kujiense]DAB38117.1 MAG TPA: response regulator [Sulfuricurvum kujiense]
MLSKELKSVASTLSILYVEDEEDTRTQISEILRMFFKKVVTAQNGKEALEIFMNTPIDLILSDISMPVMDGITLVKKILAINPKAKIIIMTAHNTDEALLEKDNLKVVGILQKPIHINKTLQLLSSVCSDIIQEALQG